MDRSFALLGCLFGVTAVAAGAFGAHALRDAIPAERLAVFETAARYQMYHALALLFVSIVAGFRPGGAASLAGWFFCSGIVLFSGSLYLLALSGARSWGAVTPVGGVLFLAGWAALGWSLMRGGPPP